MTAKPPISGLERPMRAGNTRKHSEGRATSSAHLGAESEVLGGEVRRAGAALKEQPLGLELHHLGLVRATVVLQKVLKKP